jgi:hypothetical protein
VLQESETHDAITLVDREGAVLDANLADDGDAILQHLDNARSLSPGEPA